MHPSSLDLEAFAVGEPSEATETHLEACAECRAFVEKLGGLTAPPMPELEAARPSKPGARFAVGLIVPLAAAALVFFVLRRPPPGSSPGGDPLPTPSFESSPASEPETTFKGALPIAVVRERAGQQARFTSHAMIRPGDRLRVEVALDREQAISAGVLGDDGSWLELMPEGPRPAGTHFSERAARVDAEPLRGTVLVGPPALVAVARSTRNFQGVSTLRLEWESP